MWIFIEQNFGPHIEQNSAVLKSSCGQRLVVHRLGGLRVERERELLLPVEGVAGAGERVVAVARAGAVAGDVGGVGGDLVGDDPLPHVVGVGQAEVLLGRHVAEHGRAVLGRHRGADGARDVVVAGGDVGDERAEHVERRLVAELQLLLHVHRDLVERDVAGPLDHDLHVVLPGAPGQLAERLQLGELGRVGGVGEAAGAQAVAEREGHVVPLEDLADVVEVRVERVLRLVGEHPLRHERAAARDDAGDALRRERDVVAQHAGVDGHVVDALLGLVLDDVEHELGREVGHVVHVGHGLVDGHRADRERAVRG